MTRLNRADTNHKGYKRLVECSILEAVERGAKSFYEILLYLPGVYPSVALKAFRHLKSVARIPIWIEEVDSKKEFLDSSEPVLSRNRLPVPHPLDFEWRFNQQAVELILEHCYQFSRQQDTIVFMGVPSVFEQSITLTQLERKLILIDASKSNIAYFANQATPAQLLHCDLMRAEQPEVSAQIVVLDAPWYPEYIQRFLYVASRCCLPGGYVLASMPPVGTRPGMEEEWQNYLQYAQETGLELIELQSSALPYLSPYFEQNALRAEGITNYPACWRRGNLAIFRRLGHPKSISIGEFPNGGAWEEIVIQKVRIRVRDRDDVRCVNPSLKQIIPGDILPTVSRRDARINNVDVWTSGNRIFRCDKPSLLKTILKTIAAQKPIHEELTMTLARTPTQKERILAEVTARQIDDVVKLETAEMIQYGA